MKHFSASQNAAAVRPPRHAKGLFHPNAPNQLRLVLFVLLPRISKMFINVEAEQQGAEIIKPHNDSKLDLQWKQQWYESGCPEQRHRGAFHRRNGNLKTKNTKVRSTFVETQWSLDEGIYRLSVLLFLFQSSNYLPFIFVMFFFTLEKKKKQCDGTMHFCPSSILTGILPSITSPDLLIIISS